LVDNAHARDMSLEQEVLRIIQPSPQRRGEIEASVKDLLERVEKTAKRSSLGLQVMLVGSVAKDTFLNEPDIDVFVLFPEDVPKAKLEEIGLALGRQVLGEGEERYAEHPYIHGTWKGLEVDLVPCYAITDTCELMSAVDRTPFHTRYVQSHLKQEQKAEVRLLKQFAKGIGVYGAEAKVQGFSGYLLELLVIKYGSFREVLEAVSHWKFGTAVDIEGQRTKRFDDPLVFYDPVDPSRNVASALSVDRFALLIYAAKEYLRGPAERFFFPRRREPLELDTIRKIMNERGTEMLVVGMDRPALIDDNLYPQVRKTLDGLVALLTGSDFRVLDRAYHISDRIWMAVEMERATLPNARRHHGPPAWIENAEAFLEKWRSKGLGEPFLENGHWVVITQREYPNAGDLVAAKLSSTALGSDLKDLKGLEAEAGPSAIKESNRGVLSSLLDKRKNWEI
jgi:tRNA nucleotidyltransferase (CCA-adding enzyme)